MVRFLKTTAMAVSALFVLAGGGLAATLPSPTITFSGLTSDSNGAGAPIYTENGFNFDPTWFQTGNCSPYPNPSDPCIKETQQTGLVTTMTTTVPGRPFSLHGFFFDLQGTGGSQATNELVVSSSKTDATTELVFRINASAPSGTQLYTNYTGTSGDIYNGNIGNNDPYYATVMSPLFQDVEFVTWRTVSTTNARIDDISASIPPIPLPAAGWMLLVGIGGLAAMRRRWKA